MSLMERLKKNSTLEFTDVLDESKVFNGKDLIPTAIPAFNVALSGSFTEGFGPGLYQLAGHSRMFKTGFCLLAAKAYLDEYPDAVVLFFDSEFGAPQSYFRAAGIDPARVLHVPILNVEEFKFEVTKQLDGIKRGDHVFILVDSIGNLASKKEADDALEGNSKVDMTRAKQIKSVFRIITPHLNLKNIPMFVVNHIYSGGANPMYPTDIVSGGSGITLSSDWIGIVSRRQQKEGTEVVGYDFVIKIEKGRHVREKMKIPITIKHGSGVTKWSGLMDMALEANVIVKSGPGWYQLVDEETGEVIPQKMRLKDTESMAFWKPLLASPRFNQYITDTYKVSNGDLVSEDEVLPDIEEDEDE